MISSTQFSTRNVWIVISMFLPSVLSWSCPGHMITAHIAKQLIGPEKASFFKTYVDNIASQYPNVGTMTEAACWADDIKGDGIKQYSDWHYVNECFSADGTPCPSATQEGGDLLIKLPELIYNITHSTDIQTLSFSFDFILHLIGDLHQPLHVVTEYSKHFVRGDEGGNLFPIVYHPSSGPSSFLTRHSLNLHSYCDAVGEDKEFSFYRPLGSDKLDKMDQIVSELLNITISEEEVTYTDASSFHMWANTTYTIAVDSIYLNGKLQPGTVLSEDYVSSSRQVLMRQLVLGGRRLASVLEWIYANKVSDSLSVNVA